MIEGFIVVMSLLVGVISAVFSGVYLAQEIMCFFERDRSYVLLGHKLGAVSLVIMIAILTYHAATL